MFSIETPEDVKILRELTGSANDSRIRDLELEVKELSETNAKLLDLTNRQKKTIEKMNKSLVTADQCKDIVFELLNSGSKPELLKERMQRVAKPVSIDIDNEDFVFTKVMQKKFNKILIEGNKLIHSTVRNQRMDIPISTVELLAFVEVYKKRERKLRNIDQRKICKLFNINKVQFGKLYYNIQEGIFFEAINEIDNQIRGTNFKFKNGTIHIVDGANLIDTKIDSKTFNYLLNVYVNSNQPYSTIYKLSKEKKNINPVHLLTVLRKNSAASKAIMNG